MLARRVLILLLITAFVVPALAFSAPASAQEGPPQVGIRPVAPPYALHGPYWVGVRDFVIGEDTEHSLEVSVWYPALNPEGLEEVIDYQILFKLKDDPTIPGVIAGHALRDAVPDMAAAPYPLVVFSHGFTTNRQTYAYLTEHLASYGFVVIAVDHIEYWDMEWRELAESAFERPMDIQQVIAYAETLAAPGGEMVGLFDINQIGVAGHSYGGYTALAAAGAQFNTATFNARCADTLPDTEFAGYCAQIIPAAEDLAALAGLDALPEGAWPSWGDSRVRAVVSLAGSPLIQADGLKQVTVPLLAMVGSLDTGGEGAAATRDIYEQVGSTQKALVTFAMADHMIFQWACKDVPALVGIGFFGSCSDPIWDLDRTHDLTNHFVTAFLLATLRGDADAVAALAPEAVPPFRGIAYEAQGF